MIDGPAQRAFGQAKLATLPRVCRECEVLDMCNGECPKNRFVRTPDGEPGGNYLCPGYRRVLQPLPAVRRRRRGGMAEPGAMSEPRRTAAPERLHPRGFKPKWLTAQDVLDSLGWRKAIVEAAPWLLERRYLFYWYDLRHIAAARPAAVPLSLERAGESNLSDFMALRPGYYTRELLEKRLARGHAGFLGRSRGRPVFSRWVFLDRVYLPYLGRTLVLPEGDSYTDETYVAPPFRGLRIFSGSVFSTQTALRELGLVRAFSAIASWNAAPLKDAPRAGGIPFGACRIIRRVRRRVVSWKGEIRAAGDGTISFLEPHDQSGFSTT